MTVTYTIPPGHRCDWWQIITDLQGHMSLEGIAVAIDIPKSTLAGFKNKDAEPKHADGVRLLDLWVEHGGGDPPLVEGSVRVHRFDSNDSFEMRQKCPTCGRTMRGYLLEKWTQLQAHFGASKPDGEVPPAPPPLELEPPR